MSQGTKCAVGGGVGVAAYHGHTGQCSALLGAYHVHDTLAWVVDFELFDAVLDAVIVQGLHLNKRDRVFNAAIALGALFHRGGHVVVRRCQVGIQTPGLTVGQTQAFKRLGRGHFVEQLAVDVDQRRTIIALFHQVLVPEFVVKGLT